ERVDFAIDVAFAQSARDQLGDLAAEIDNQKTFMGGHVGALCKGFGLLKAPAACSEGPYVAFLTKMAGTASPLAG
ncbi:MAG: hypothetical protein AAGA63_09295, partial [Pseudomonadota bacterium]